MKYRIRIRWGDGSVGQMVKTFDARKEAENAAAKLNELNAITSRGTIHHWVEEVADDEQKNQARA